jgi:hypothetical protein
VDPHFQACLVVQSHPATELSLLVHYSVQPSSQTSRKINIHCIENLSMEKTDGWCVIWVSNTPIVWEIVFLSLDS